MANTYCLQGAAAGGDGSLLAPWNSFGSISWGGPGDHLYIGGTWQAQLTQAGDGDATAQFTVRGDYPGNPGIIDGELTRTWCIVSLNHDYITINNIELDSGGTNLGDGGGLQIYQSDNCIVDNLYAHHCGGSGILIEQCNNTDVINSQTDNCYLRGMIISSVAGTSSNCTMRDSTASGNGRRGLTISGTGAVSSVVNSSIIRCIANGNGEGAELEYCDNCGVYDSTFTNNTLEGLDPYSNEEGWGVNVFAATNVNIVGNYFDGNRGPNIGYTGSAGQSTSISIIGNVLLNGVQDSIKQPTATRNISTLVSGNYIHSADPVVRLWLVNTNDDFIECLNNTFVGGTAGFRTGSTVTNAVVKNNIFLNQDTYCVFNNSGGSTIDTDSNCYWLNGSANNVAELKINNINKTGAAIADYDANYINEDPLLGSDYYPANPNLIATGIPTGYPVSVDINGEPFPSVDRDIGCVQGTDATNHPFHPLNL